MHVDWTVNMGSLIGSLLASVFTAVSIGGALLAAHRQNIRTAQEQNMQIQRRLEHIETRMDLIYDWFMNRVVKRTVVED